MFISHLMHEIYVHEYFLQIFYTTCVLCNDYFNLHNVVRTLHILCKHLNSCSFVANLPSFLFTRFCVNFWPQKQRSDKSFDKFHVWSQLKCTKVDFSKKTFFQKQESYPWVWYLKSMVPFFFLSTSLFSVTIHIGWFLITDGHCLLCGH